MAYLLENCAVDVAAARRLASRQGHGFALELALALAAHFGNETKSAARKPADQVLAALANSTPLGRRFDLELRPSLSSKLEFLARTCLDPTVDDLVYVQLPISLHQEALLNKPLCIISAQFPTLLCI